MLGEMIQLCLLTSFWTVSCQLPPSSWRRLQGNLTWFFYGNFKLDLTFFTAFSKKKQEHAFWPCISPPPPFFWVKFLIFSQRTKHFPVWGLWSSSGPSDSQCPSFCSSRPPMPPRRGTVNGGVVNKFSPNNSGVKHRCFSGTKKEWHSFCSHPK